MGVVQVCLQKMDEEKNLSADIVYATMHPDIAYKITDAYVF